MVQVSSLCNERIDQEIATLIRRMGEHLTRVPVFGFAIARRVHLDNRNQSRRHLSRRLPIKNALQEGVCPPR